MRFNLCTDLREPWPVVGLAGALVQSSFALPLTCV